MKSKRWAALPACADATHPLKSKPDTAKQPRRPLLIYTVQMPKQRPRLKR